MKALVKSQAAKGLWLEDIPEPAIGINDVLIRVRYTGICGTDVHIYKWDDWAQKTIPVPMVIGHEFVGEIVEVGSNVNDFFPGDIVSGEGHVVCGRCRNCLAGRRHLCADTQGVGVNRARRLRRIHRAAHDQHLAPSPRHRPGSRRHLRSLRQRRAHRAVVSRAGRRRADHRRRPHRHHGRPPSRATPARATSSSPTSTLTGSTWRARWAPPLAVNVQRDTLAEVQKQLGMTEGFDVGLEMSGNPAALRDMIANMSHGGKIAMLGIPAEGNGHRLAHRSSSTCSPSRASTAARCTRPGTR